MAGEGEGGRSADRRIGSADLPEISRLLDLPEISRLLDLPEISRNLEVPTTGILRAPV